MIDRGNRGEFRPGLVPHNKKWDKSACEDAGRRWFQETGRPPASSEWQPNGLLTRMEAGDEGAMRSYELYVRLQCPNYSVVYRLYGSWTAFIASMNLFPYHTSARNYGWVLKKVKEDG